MKPWNISFTKIKTISKSLSMKATQTCMRCAFVLPPLALTRHKMADTARPSQSPTSEASFLTGMACVDIHVLGHDNSDEYPASPSSRKTSNQMAQAEQDRTK